MTPPTVPEAGPQPVEGHNESCVTATTLGSGHHRCQCLCHDAIERAANEGRNVLPDATDDQAAVIEQWAASVTPPSSPRAGRPEIVCLCGSTRFYNEFQQANYDLTMAGKIVLSVGFYPHAKAKHGHGEGVGHDSSEKVALDELHKRKIDLADEVLVLNVDGYIGESTRSEIEYAEAHGKPVRYLMERCYEADCQDQGHFSGRDLHWKRTDE